MNEDGIFSVTDVVAARKIMAGEDDNQYNKLAADVNGDGIVSVTDVVLIRQLVANNEN